MAHLFYTEKGLVMYDEETLELLTAEVPNSGLVVARQTGSRGGNTAHDAASGKFTSKPKTQEEVRQQVAANVDPLEYKRMLDAVRDAAREFDTPDEGDIREFLAGRAANPAQVDVAGFLARVQEQRLSDLADLIDQQLRSGGSLKRGRRTVKVSAPRGYTKRSIAQLSQPQVAEMTNRLVARGHDQENVEKFFASRTKSG